LAIEISPFLHLNVNFVVWIYNFFSTFSFCFLEYSFRIVGFLGSVSPYKLGKVVLKLQAGLFSNVVMPETVESLWGPVPLGRLPPGAVNHCTVANHKYVIMSSLYVLRQLRLSLSQ